MKWWLRAANGVASGCRSACNNSPINRARFFPLAQAKRREVSLRSELGNVKLVVKYGQDRQTQQRLEQPPAERQPERPASRLAVLMVDGWMARFRGEGWGKKRTKKTRVDWHEIKTGVFYLHEQSAHKEAGRGLIQDKVIVHCQGDAMAK